MNVTDTWRLLVRRPEGASPAEVAAHCGRAPNDAGKIACKLRLRGELFSAALGFGSTRFFISQAAADAWKAKQRDEPRPLKIAPSKPRKPDPVGNFKSQQAVIPPHVKVQICPTRWT